MRPLSICTNSQAENRNFRRRRFAEKPFCEAHLKVVGQGSLASFRSLSRNECQAPVFSRLRPGSPTAFLFSRLTMFRRIFTIAALCYVIALTTRAQTTNGLITGTISDPTGALVQGIPVAGQVEHREPVFRVGEFDRSSQEFLQGLPDRPVVVDAGPTGTDGNWYATQPAISGTLSDRGANARTAESTIRFNLDSLPAAVYKLHIALLIESKYVPALRIAINGKSGTYYPQPELDYEGGDRAGASSPVYSHADIKFGFPGIYLRQGTNTITLQAIEDESSAPNASLTYDAIELYRPGSDINLEGASAKVIPTIFFQQGDGRLNEIVEVLLRYVNAPEPADKIDLTIAGRHYSKVLDSHADFGEELCRFAVPEFPAGTSAHLDWTAGGQQRHFEQTIDPKKKWTLFLVPHIHLDVGFTGYQAKISAIQSRVIDEAMKLTAQHPEFRFSVDGSWALDQFLKSRTRADRDKVIAAIKDRTLFVPAQYANLLTGFPTAETLIRSLYFSADFSRTYGTPFDYANITDVPSYTWSYPSILKSAGLSYFLAASNNHHAPVLLQGRLNEDSPFWWEGPDGQRVLMWYSRTYGQMAKLFGLPPKLSAGHDTLPLFLQQYEHPGYRAAAAIIFGTQGENSDLFPQQAELVEKWNNMYAFPHLQYSGFKEALEEISGQFGAQILTVRGDGGPYWELGIGSDAYFAGLERENESIGPSAEKLDTLSALVDPQIAVDKTDLDDMWKNMLLMDEHTWGAADSVKDPDSSKAVQQLAVKDAYATRARGLADFISRNSMTNLANSILVGKRSLIVFNTLNWTRNAPVFFDLGKGNEVVDPSTGQVIPVEVISQKNTLDRVSFVARDVPSVGYKVYQIRPTKLPPPPLETIAGSVIENEFYRVQLDPSSGAVLSIYDKQLRRELVNRQSPYRFGQYLYVTGGDRTPNGRLLQSWYRPFPDLHIDPSHSGRLLSIEKSPDGMVARLTSMATNTPRILSQVRLFNGAKKIEFDEDIDKTSVTSEEAVYFAFPFAMEKPQFRYEIQTGTVDPAKDMYPGAGHEWFSVQHWVSAEEDGLSGTVMPLDVPLVTLGDIDRNAWPRQFGKRSGTIFSFAMNNYWEDNYRAAQGGHFRFRYVVTSAHTTDVRELSRMGWEEMTPLEYDEVTHRDKAIDVPRRLEGNLGSFLEVGDAKLLLEAWKPAEDGNGTILRFLDLGGGTRPVKITSALFNLKEVFQTDSVERDRVRLPIQDDHSFNITVHPHEIVTIRAVLK